MAARPTLWSRSAGTAAEIIYDPTVYTVEVDITDNGDGTLDVALVEGSDDPEALDFINILKTYYIELLKLDGRDETTALAGASFETAPCRWHRNLGSGRTA